MGRTLPSITQAFLQEQQSLARFRRALRLDDQRALDGLLASSRHHLAAAAYASPLLPFEVMLLAMLVEQHKELMRLRTLLEEFVPEEIPPQQAGPDVDNPSTREDHGDSSLAAPAARSEGQPRTSHFQAAE